jgi:hypothetical protein
LENLKEDYGEGFLEAVRTIDEVGADASDSQAGKLQDLQILVGKGRQSIGPPQLKATAISTFKAMGLEAEQV